MRFLAAHRNDNFNLLYENKSGLYNDKEPLQNATAPAYT